MNKRPHSSKRVKYSLRALVPGWFHGQTVRTFATERAGCHPFTIRCWVFCCFSASSGGGGQARRVDVDVTVHGLLARGLQPHLGNGLLRVRVGLGLGLGLGLGVSAQLLPYYLPTCSRPRLLT